MQRVLVVPWSIAATNFSISILLGDEGRQVLGSDECLHRWWSLLRVIACPATSPAITDPRSLPHIPGFSAAMSSRSALSGFGVWPISSTTIIAVSWSSTWLMVTIWPSFISCLMTSEAFTLILCARSATLRSGLSART